MEAALLLQKKSRHYFAYDALSSINIYEFQLQFYWKLFPSVKLKYTSNGMDNGLVPNMREAIIWTSDGIAYGRRFPSLNLAELAFWLHPQIAKFKGPTWGPTGSCRPQVGPMLAPRTLLLGSLYRCSNPRPIFLRFRWREYGLSHWEKLFLLRLLPSTETVLALFEKTNQGPATMVIEWSYWWTIMHVTKLIGAKLCKKNKKHFVIVNVIKIDSSKVSLTFAFDIWIFDVMSVIQHVNIYIWKYNQIRGKWLYD